MIVLNKVFRCGTFHRKTRTPSMAVTDDKPYRETLLIIDRKSNRPGGLSYPERIRTVDCRGCTCKFQFIVKWDMVVGFFVELKKKLVMQFILPVQSCLTSHTYHAALAY